MSQSDPIVVGALRVSFLVTPEASGGSVAVFACTAPAAARMPAPHSHDAFEETIYGLDGVSSWTIDGRRLEVGPGEAVCIPRGAVHGFENRGELDARFLAIATPGLIGPAYFEEIGALLAAGAGPPDPAAVAQLMRRHGLTLARPAAA